MWLWCARFMRARGDCAAWVADGLLRVNRQPTDKPHYRLRVGDVVTLALRHQVRVIEVLALATRRGPAAEARALYREIEAPRSGVGLGDVATSCGVGQTSAYRDGS
jgi:ribosome-associated heat shock protein Hsp15